MGASNNLALASPPVVVETKTDEAKTEEPAEEEKPKPRKPIGGVSMFPGAGFNPAAARGGLRKSGNNLRGAPAKPKEEDAPQQDFRSVLKKNKKKK